MPTFKATCLLDLSHEWTISYNKYFEENRQTKFICLAVGGVLMDIVALFQFYKFSMQGKTWRFAIAITFYYSLRFVINSVFRTRYPQNYLWEFPNFYSVTVPYGKTNNFFLTGHLGLCIICLLEYRANKQFFMMTLAYLTLIFQIFLVMVLRAHYLIDILSALCFGHYFFMMAERVAHWIDFKLLKIPFDKRFPYFSKHCTKCEFPLNKWATSKKDFPKGYSHDMSESLNQK